MATSESQLITWSHQGAIQTSASTYESVKTCIESINWNSDVEYVVYLQGSYKNTTNIRGNSDVDIIVELSSVFYSNKYSLPPEQLAEFDNYYGVGKYELAAFKKVVLSGLQNRYGQDKVTEGNKSIKIKGSEGRLDADVTCCAQYREYKSFSKSTPDKYIKGITFWQKNNGIQIRNFPHNHYDNGVTKNQNSGSNYKATSRIIKNIKARLIELNRITNDLAPSYYIECLLYNVPSRNFNQDSYQDIIGIILDYLATQSDSGKLANFLCQNECRYLFSGIDPHWNEENCKLFLQQLIRFYNEG
jgi:hypothetical protein